MNSARIVRFSPKGKPNLFADDDFILVKANPSLLPAKFGYYNPEGWLGY
ncbi:MAG: hypothetical protein WBW94_17460 [Anaerolineales bacterium]